MQIPETNLRLPQSSLRLPQCDAMKTFALAVEESGSMASPGLKTKPISGHEGCQSPRMLWLLPPQLCTVRRLRRGAHVYLASDKADSVYYLRKGSVSLVRFSQAGDAAMIDRYHTGSLFGNLCFCNGPLSCEGRERDIAVALEDSEVLVTTLESVKRNLWRSPEKLFALLGDYCRRLAVARLRIEGLVLYPAEVRLAHTLLLMTAQQNGYPGSVILNPRMTHEELARCIGVTRPFMTRLMRRLRNRGFIEPLADGHLLVHREKIVNAYS